MAVASGHSAILLLVSTAIKESFLKTAHVPALIQLGEPVHKMGLTEPFEITLDEDFKPDEGVREKAEELETWLKNKT